MSQHCPHGRLAVQDSDLSGRGSGICQTFRYGPARAAIAALYDGTREGADAARRATGAGPGPAPAAALTGVPG